MKFTDIFIERPVLATVISLMILVLGLRALFSLPILQFPRTQNAIVTVATTYYGADNDTLAGFITTPLETAIAQANGIDYMTSTSNNGVSTIAVNLRLNYDADRALTEIQTKISAVLNQLPTGSQQPTLSIKVGQTVDAMYIGFSSTVLAPNQVTDYLNRVVQPKLQAVPGVQTAELLGQKNFALRAWLDPQKMAAYGVTATDVSTALANNNFISGLGTTKGQMVQVNLTASTNLTSLDQFRRLIVRQGNGAVVRLADVATVSLGSDDYETQVAFDGRKAVYIGIQVAPTANLLDVVKGIRKVFPDIQAQLPNGLDGLIVYDSTDFVNSSIHEVVRTLIEALLIVTLVVFAFLGSPRSVLIPVVAIPLSLVGTFTMMLLFGFSVNLLTLLALVLAIGLVVDDAIIVVENVNRHLDEGMERVEAAKVAARELAGPIIAMTIVLVAVYIPIGFQGGLTGALFTEFAFTLVGAVTVSAIIALTLSPMMCSRFLRPPEHRAGSWEDRFIKFIDGRFERLRRWYGRKLNGSLSYIPVTLTFAAIVLASIFFLYPNSQQELAPQEDQGVLITLATDAANATLDQREIYQRAIWNIGHSHPEQAHMFQLDIPGQPISGMVLKPWDVRAKTVAQIMPEFQREIAAIPGSQVVAFSPPPLPGSNGLPIQFILESTQDALRMNEVAQKFLGTALKSGLFIFLQTDLKLDQPRTEVVIDRDKASLLGLQMSDVGRALASMLGGAYVNYFSLDQRSYKVIPQVERRFRLNADQLNDYYIHTGDGSTVPVSTVVSMKTRTIPEVVAHFQQLNSATIQGVAFPGVAEGDALKFLQKLAHDTLPQGYSVDYGGPSRQYIQESTGFIVTFLFALIIIFLALSAQFESFRDPLIILVSVPMSIAGAMLFICTGLAHLSLNIYTKVGLVTLMGLISKHGILIVEFANSLQAQGYSKRDAIREAAGIRLRPILMTTAAMVLGVVPLIAASGAGAVSRQHMGLVIASGLAIGTLFTLFVVPAVYVALATDHGKKRAAEGKAATPVPGAPLPH